MSLANDIVDVRIDVQSGTLKRANFGTPIVVGYTALFQDRTKTYGDASEVATDFPNASDPNRLALEAAFAADPHPSVVKFGRRALPPTRTVTMIPLVTTEGFVYDFTVEVLGGATTVQTAVSYTVPSSASPTSVAAAISTSIDAAAGIGSAAVTGTITVDADAPGGEWRLVFPSRVQAEAWTIADTTTDPGIATDLTAIRNADADWYGFGLVAEGKLEQTAAAAWAESNGEVLYVTTTADSAVADATAGNVALTLTGLSYKRTLVPFYRQASTRDWAAIRLLAMALTYDPSEIQWAYKTLPGLVPDDLSTATLANLEAVEATCYVDLAGKSVTAGPWAVKDCSGEWADVRHGIDWLTAEVRTRVLEQLIFAKKTPFTQAGIDSIEAAIRGALAAGAANVITNDYRVEMPKLSAISSADKAARRLPGVKFYATLQGAITSTVIRGLVTV